MNCASGWAPKIGQDPLARRTNGHLTLTVYAQVSCPAKLRCCQPSSQHSTVLASIEIRLDLKDINLLVWEAILKYYYNIGI